MRSYLKWYLVWDQNDIPNRSISLVHFLFVSNDVNKSDQSKTESRRIDWCFFSVGDIMEGSNKQKIYVYLNEKKRENTSIHPPWVKEKETKSSAFSHNVCAKRVREHAEKVRCEDKCWERERWCASLLINEKEKSWTLHGKRERRRRRHGGSKRAKQTGEEKNNNNNHIHPSLSFGSVEKKQQISSTAFYWFCWYSLIWMVPWRKK